MKNALTLGTLLLGCCLAATAQTGSTPNQTPPISTPSTFPQDQTGQIPSNPANPADPSAIPPDTNAPGQVTHDHAGDQASSSQETTIQGCLSRSSQGNFMLADNSGTQFQLRGDTSKLNSYVGKEVKVDGMAMSGGSNTSAMSSASGSSMGTSTQFTVSDVHKVADACTTSSAK
jgi:hypothetical protein